MSALHRAHWGAWASRRDLGFCGGVTYAPLGIQALKPFLVCSEPRPDQRHRNPHRPQSLVGRSVRTSSSLVETWSVNFAANEQGAPATRGGVVSLQLVK